MASVISSPPSDVSIGRVPSPSPRRPPARPNTGRATVVSVGPHGMISIACGKGTTFRHIGSTLVDQPRIRLPLTLPLTRPCPLPGAASVDAVEQVLGSAAPDLPDDVAAHLVRRYGSFSHEILARGSEDPALLNAYTRTARTSGRRWSTRSNGNGHASATTFSGGGPRSPFGVSLRQKSGGGSRTSSNRTQRRSPRRLRERRRGGASAVEWRAACSRRRRPARRHSSRTDRVVADGTRRDGRGDVWCLHIVMSHDVGSRSTGGRRDSRGPVGRGR